MQIFREEGTAVVLAMMASALLLASGAAVVLTTAVESGIAASFGYGSEALYAADAGLELAVGELRNLADWSPVLDGSTHSAFVDGGPGGVRVLADGATINLDQIVNLANCLKPTGCSDAEMNAITPDRPWGINNPRWRPYAYGSLAALVGASPTNSSTFVVVLVSDDPAENDGDPSHDGVNVAGVANPGRGVLLLRAEGFGPHGAHRAVEATLRRIEVSQPDNGVLGEPTESAALVVPVGPPSVRLLAWRPVRQP